MGFQHAGSLTGAAPVVRRYSVGMTMYVGQLVTSAISGSIGGHVNISGDASATFEKEQPILGIVSAVASNDRTYVASATDHGYGDRATYTTDQATIAANLGTGLTGGGEVDVTLIVPGDTLIRAPIYDTTYGTALTVLVEDDGDSNGLTITHAGETVACILDDYTTVYCRTGANKGQYRVATTAGTNAQVVTIPFPYTIGVGDTFVAASCILGYGGFQPTTYIDAIDGDHALDDFFLAQYHEINLEEAGKEYAIFSLMAPGIDALTAS
jgi:hypothetical protein